MSLSRVPRFASHRLSRLGAPTIRPTQVHAPPLIGLQAHRAALHSSSITRSASAHEDHYDPPSGWLWGVPPSERGKKEGWETIWFYGFFGSLALAAVAYAFKPDTSIQTWALEEARRRLEAEGILPDPDVTSTKK
ncbi:hypothetical protein L228DRAFT_272265 [Xylona heveae TC161]|uniref:NADH dehydrogenase [ubiquinone] 1 beta subcomplex subunit 11, mitochondrial n=1 Tax=Xylona heveae (strain CBS 132557 / TC161) TaxID=1328760 RepID=A0A165JJS2_XYLHT|nr:hypothetical protein L228DRAFT_272265 [Xylona heveae TC161]KZF26325.1 hypothetical protein L228DRAFT_272265 [Xylona heveae TC161]